MQAVDLNNPGEKKKLIWAGLLGLVALVFLWWALIGFGSSSKPASKPAAVATAKPNQTTKPPGGETTEDLSAIRPINFQHTPSNVPEAKRNIFAYYEPPAPKEKLIDAPTPTPTPTPPVLLASVSPSNVYARTGDFTLEVSGDKFSAELRIYVDGRELGTKYRGPQQLSATMPAAMISSPGARQIMVRSPDNRIYSNSVSLNVAPPPIPNYSYVGIIGTIHHVDTAILQDKGTKEVLNVQRGDVLGGRFRVTSISDKELVLVDTNLKIKHNLAMSEGERGSTNPLTRPTPNVDVDDEPGD